MLPGVRFQQHRWPIRRIQLRKQFLRAFDRWPQAPSNVVGLVDVLIVVEVQKLYAFSGWLHEGRLVERSAPAALQLAKVGEDKAVAVEVTGGETRADDVHVLLRHVVVRIEIRAALSAEALAAIEKATGSKQHEFDPATLVILRSLSAEGVTLVRAGSHDSQCDDIRTRQYENRRRGDEERGGGFLQEALR